MTTIPYNTIWWCQTCCVYHSQGTSCPAQGNWITISTTTTTTPAWLELLQILTTINENLSKLIEMQAARTQVQADPSAD